MILAGVLGFGALCAIGYLLLLFFGGGSTPPPPMAPAVVTQPVPSRAKAVSVAGTSGGAAVKVGTVSAQLDPTLHMDGMLEAEAVEYRGTGRNVFAPGPLQAPAPETATNKFPPRPAPVPPPLAPQGPPPPPPINLKFFGVATQRGVKHALLLSGEDVFLASAGDVVARRYKIVAIATNSITVEDLPNSNKQTLPLVVN